ncbi:lipocalin-like domain-containing protein [Microseira wollei]|uniref:Lipocalin-like domain-containing protein n=1 Tax=Microseira wollei NIES-4236 TaxID=2530354 RepID=A0AAV3WJ56_9CYAN|nr:lipocalin-like domain-containing protein [Microseira wollei]GET39924.1 hypothetical protein MiSe_46960 [Microseira wollei NIES-4236]
MTQNQFVGVWRLASTEIKDDQGNRSELYGPDATGLIIYTEEGYFSAHLKIPNPPDPMQELVVFMGEEVSEEERWTLQAFPRFTNLSYGGRYEVQPDKVINYGDFFSNMTVSGAQPRYFEFADNRLTLSLRLPIPGTIVRAYLHWERV